MTEPIKRYDVSSSRRKVPLGNGQYIDGVGMGTKSVEYENGDWVKYEDVADRLQSQADELKGHREKWGGPTISAHPAMIEQMRQNNELHAEIKTQADEIDKLKQDRDHADDEVGQKNVEIERLKAERDIFEKSYIITGKALKEIRVTAKSCGYTSFTLETIDEALKQIEKA